MPSLRHLDAEGPIKLVDVPVCDCTNLDRRGGYRSALLAYISAPFAHLHIMQTDQYANYQMCRRR